MTLLASKVAKKNLFDKNTTPFELGSINSADGQSSTNNLLFVVRTKGFIPVKPYTKYTFNKVLGDYNIIQPYCYDSNFNYVGRAPSFTYGNDIASFSTTGNTAYVRLQYNHISASYVITESERKVFDNKVQLEEGSTATPYEPYQALNDSPTLYPLGNLLNPDLSNWEQGSAGGKWEPFNDSTRLRIAERIILQPNTQYTVKVNGFYDVFVRFFSLGSMFEVGNTGWLEDGKTFTTPSNCYLTGVIIRRKDNSTISLDEIKTALPMIAKGFYTENIPYQLSNLRSV